MSEGTPHFGVPACNSSRQSAATQCTRGAVVDRDVIIVGKKAPVFSLKNQRDEIVRLTRFVGQWGVLCFYPKDDPPGCTTEACECSLNICAFGKLDVVGLICSSDGPEQHRAFVDKHKLPVTLWSDPN